MNKDNNLRGILFMIASMVAFSVADTLVKLSTSSISPAQVLFYLLGGGLIIFALMAKLQGDKLNDPRAFLPILLLRYFTEIAGMVGMVMALANVPISVVGAITQASPMLATVGAFLFLKENVGWRRWCSIVVGFVGVLLIVQPGAIEFDFAILWAILAALALSIRDLTTRLIPADMASASIATYTMIAAVPFTIGWVLFNGESLLPAQINWFVIIPMVVLGAIGYMLLIASIRMAEVSVVMPFRYSRIIFLLILGILVFEEKPDALMLIGASLIILSGIYMMWREQVAKNTT
ncbi:MAG: drug/metabolite transporter (DMT)-like permease [Gammaproteobacteria bacterium]|jgi:drug/metabolite transporter (DMT)-like permease